MGVRAVWLADAARLTGYPVLEVAGWRGRGHGDFRLIEGVVLHHTADGPTGNYPSLGVVRDGRAGLRGPLANLGLARDGTVLVIADGVGWHAGASQWAGFRDLNDEFIGIEAESVGTRDDWTPQQRDCYPRLVAACLFYLRRGADRACSHRECALPRGRKIDPAFWDLPGLRRHVAHLLADPLLRIPRFAQEAPDLDANQAQQLAEIHRELTARLPRRIDGSNFRDTLYGYALNADSFGYRAAEALARLEAATKALNDRVAALSERPAVELDVDQVVERVVEAVTAAGIADAVLDGLSDRLAPPAA